MIPRNTVCYKFIRKRDEFFLYKNEVIDSISNISIHRWIF